MADPFLDFLKGLSPEDTLAAITDQICFGTAFVHEVDGVKRRVDPNDVLITNDAD